MRAGRRMKAQSERVERIVTSLMEDVESYEGGIGRDLQRLWRQYLHPQRWSIFFALALTAVWSTHGYVFALFSRFLVDNVLLLGAEGPRPSFAEKSRVFAIYVAGLFSTWGVVTVTQWLRSWLIIGAGQRIVFGLRKELHEKLQRLHVGYFEHNETGRLMSRVLEDVWMIREWTTTHALNILAAVFQFVVGLGILLVLNWKLSLIIVAAIPVYAWSFIVFRPIIRKFSIALRRINSSMYALSAERIDGIQVVKAFTQEHRELATFTKRMHNNVRLSMRVVLSQGALSLIAGVVTALVSGIIIYVGFRQVQSGAMSAGDVMVFVFSMPRVFMQVNTLATVFVTIQAVFVVIQRVFRLLDEPEEVAPGRIKLDGMEGKIDFDHVTFYYPGQSDAALKDVTFHISPGRKVALMGPSGAGKSTVFQLICRFYDPQEGSIRLGGVNLVDADSSSVRRHAVMVQQEPMIFSGTVAENIAYGRLDATPSEIMTATKQAELHEFIMTLPVQYETEVGQNGVTLSGGQKQRLALATALLTQPEVLLLDDTTSALDAETEARIRGTLDRALLNRTSLIITQRIATAKNCDLIIVLEDGRVSQMGTHAELKEQAGFYRNIYRQQESL